MSYLYKLWRLPLTNPYGFQIRYCPTRSNMTPTRRHICSIWICVIAEQAAQLFANLDLSHGGKGAGFDGDVVGVVYHCHKVPQQRRHAHICAHVGFVPGRPGRNGMFPQKIGCRADGIREASSDTFELIGVFYGGGDEFLWLLVLT